MKRYGDVASEVAALHVPGAVGDSIDDQRRADSCSKGKQQNIGIAFARSAEVLAPQSSTGIVFNDQRKPEIRVAPAMQIYGGGIGIFIVGGYNPSLFEVDETRQREREAEAV